jgi:hypothetical protein
MTRRRHSSSSLPALVLSAGATIAFASVASAQCPAGPVEVPPASHGNEDAYGVSADISGDVLVIGARERNQAGLRGGAVVFRRSAGAWVQEADFFGPTIGSGMGHAVAVDGDTMLLGAPGWYDTDVPGQIFFYRFNGASWVLESNIKSPRTPQRDGFGVSVALDGDTAAVGAWREQDAGFRTGAVYIYQRDASGWRQTGKLIDGGGAPGDLFGQAVALDGDTLAVGAYRAGFAAGAVVLFKREGLLGWGLEARIDAPTPEFFAEFGVRVALQGDTLAIGEWLGDRAATDAGAVHLYRRSAGLWSHQTTLTAPDAEVGDRFGVSLSLDEDRLLVGAHRKTIRDRDTGAAYLFARDGSAWRHLVRLEPPPAPPAQFQHGEFGAAVALAGDLAVVGDWTHDPGEFVRDSGTAWSFDLSGCAACYADCDASGGLDFFDFLCFQNLFAASDPGADCDGFGGLDFFDFLCFQNAFAAGCP